jgi:hypothetical protein
LFAKNIKIQLQQIKELVLSDQEADTFLKALVYIRHRLKEHEGSGAESVGQLDYIKELIKQLEILR